MLFVKIFWLSIKTIARRPLVFVFLSVFSLLSFLGAGVPNISVSLFSYYPQVYGIPRPVASLGEWGRLILLSFSSGEAGLFALFISLLFLAAFWPGIAHKEPLWATPKARFYLPIAKLLAVGVVGTLVVTLASLSSLFQYIPRGIFVKDGGTYVPVYLLLTLLQSLFGASFSFLLFSLTKSRLAAVVVTAAVGIVWSMIFAWFPEAQKSIPLLALVYRSYISWNFVGPYAPFGLIPLVFALQALTLTFATIAVWTGGLLIWHKRPEWQGMKAYKGLAIFTFGTLLAFGAGIYSVVEINCYRARIPDWDLFATLRPTQLERGYIWNKDGILVFYPGRYAMTRLALESVAPWLQNVTDKRIVQAQIHDERVSLTLVLPPNSDYPAEIAGIMRYIEHQLQPVFTRLAAWKKSARIVGAPHRVSYSWSTDIQDGILIFSDVLGGFLHRLDKRFDYTWMNFLWTLTKSSGLEGCERAYLWMYLLEGLDAQKARSYLDLLAAKARGERVHLWHFLKDIKADRVLDHWQHGEEMGHENYIRMLLQGGNR